jgi:DHA1 family bicyclomycin/chloramphenicol resistance-like MFS transporter
MLTIGVITQLSAMVALLVTFFGGFVSAPAIMVEMFFLVIAMGFVFGPVTALAMMEVRFAAGTAVALLGSIQFASASVSAFLVGVVSNDALVSFITIAGTAALFVLGALLLSRARPAGNRNR